MRTADLHKLLENLINLPSECEWVEFKENNYTPEKIGERISALFNGAWLENQQYSYLIFGIEDGTHEIVGTKFKPRMERVGGEEMHHWIINRLNPKIDYKIFEFEYEGKSIVMFENPASDKRPTKFFHQGYIRIGSYTRNLNDFPEKEKRIWNKVSNVIFEKEIVKENVSAEEVVKLLDVQSYFDLKKLPLPS